MKFDVMNLALEENSFLFLLVLIVVVVVDESGVVERRKVSSQTKAHDFNTYKMATTK
jgi:hypothetical protein